MDPIKKPVLDTWTKRQTETSQAEPSRARKPNTKVKKVNG